MDKLLGELRLNAARSRTLAKRNYFCAYGVSAVIVVSSIATTLMVGLGAKPAWLSAVFASLPAAMVAASTVFRFEQKSAWLWKKTQQLDALVRGLKYEGADPIETSKAFSKIEIETEQEWISFGNLGKGNGE